MRHFRFVHVGVASAISLAGITGLGLVRDAGAVGTGTPSTFVPIVPCRLADTRSGSDNVGSRSTPLGPAESVVFAVWGTNGNCAIPTTATGIATNVTAVRPTADSYLTIYPADAQPRPTASNLNVTAGSPPTPNQVTVGLSAAGAVGAYNHGGTTDLVIDIVGYYQPAGAGSAGAQGPIGPTGPQGPIGPQGVPTPRGGTLELSGLDVLNAQFSGLGGCALFNPSGTGGAVPFDLLDGAVITDVTIKYIDSGAASLSATLVRTDAAGGYSAASADAITVDGHTSSALALLPIAAVSPSVAYYLYLTATTPPATQVELCAVSVTYTMP